MRQRREIGMNVAAGLCNIRGDVQKLGPEVQRPNVHDMQG